MPIRRLTAEFYESVPANCDMCNYLHVHIGVFWLKC